MSFADHNRWGEGRFKTGARRTTYFLGVAMIRGHVVWYMMLRCVNAESQLYERIGSTVMFKGWITGEALKSLQTTGEHTTITIQ
jgi:hypothetical protein